MIEKIVLCFTLTSKIFLGSLFLVSNEGISIEEIKPLENFQMSEKFQSLQTSENNSEFKDFLDFLASKGMGVLTLIEAAALYFVWNLAKDTKSREEILENVFDLFQQKELEVKRIGHLFRIFGLNATGFSDLTLQDITNYLKEGRKVIILHHINRTLIFLLIKKIDFDKGVFILENEIIIDNKRLNEISFLDFNKDLIFSGFVFFEESIDFKHNLCQIPGACYKKNQSSENKKNLDSEI